MDKRKTAYEMGAIDDTVNKMRRQMEAAIDDAARVHRDASEWSEIQDIATYRTTVMEVLLDRLESIAVQYAERLSR